MKIKDILFIHGITSFGNSHIALNRKLTRLGYNFHSFDLPGHGEKKSQWINHIFKFEDMVEFVVKYIEKNLKNKPFIILGHSMGGGITQVISKIFKKQVKFVIFECPFSLAMKIGSENEKYKSLMKLDRIKIKKNVDSDLEKYKNINSTDVSRILEKWLGDDKMFLPLMLSLWKESTFEKISDGFNSISIPILLMVGENDTTVKPYTTLSYMKSNKTKISIEIIKGAKHNPFKDTTNEYIRIIEKFLHKIN